MKPCPFCELPADRIIIANPLAMAIRDGFPVSNGHTLIIPKRHVGSFFEITREERQSLFELMDQEKQSSPATRRNSLKQAPTHSRGAAGYVNRVRSTAANFGPLKLDRPFRPCLPTTQADPPRRPFFSDIAPVAITAGLNLCAKPPYSTKLNPKR